MWPSQEMASKMLR